MRHLAYLVFAVAALFAFAPDCCLAESQCPWMNSATAGGFLGGDVQTIVTGVNVEGDATCEFNLGTSMLRIAVHTMTHISADYPSYLSQCGTASVGLKGIGNQAIRCILSSGEAKGEELIVGRVRDRAFLITIKAGWVTSPPTSSNKTRNNISDDSENIAEQVAGSMF